MVTNNYVEAFHRSLQRQFSVRNPGLLKFIEGIRIAQHSKDAQMERYIAGNLPPGKRNVYEECDRRLLTILNELNAGARSLYETLRGIAHKYEMNP